MSVKLSPFGPKPAFNDSSGNPLSGGKLYFYINGSTTPQNTYTDSTGGVANANPVVLNARGEPANEIWFTEGLTYKAVLKTSADVTIWSVDNISAIGDFSVVDEWKASGKTPTFVSATSFTLSADQTSAFHVGRRLKSTNTAGTVYSTIRASAFAANTTTVSVVNDSGSLDSGLSAVSYGLVSFANTSVPKIKERISPEDYGCAGDGTIDDSANFQLAATAASGKTLFLTPGKTYLIAAVDIPCSANWTTVDMTGATVKSKVLGAGVGSPIFNVTGTGKALFIGGVMDGQKASQPADGFSDSFNTGASGTGRAYRAAIKADATVATGVAHIVVRGTSFKNTYGACVATLDVPRLIVRDCYAETCNFELAYGYYSAGTLLDFELLDNVINTPASGHATVNADGSTCANYRRVLVKGNSCFNSERCFLKVEGGRNIEVIGNIADTNTVNNFPGIQVSCTSALLTSRVVISNNDTFNTGKGIYVSVVSGQPDTVTITGNNIYTTTGSTLGDGIAVDDAKNLTISGNHCVDIKRHGVYVSGAANRAKISSNNLYGQGTAGTQAIILGADTGSWGSVSVQDNHCEHFEESAVGSGVVVFGRSAAFTFGRVSVQGNTIMSASASNRALRAGADILGAGIISDNYIEGQLEHLTAAIDTRDNTVTGTVSIPELSFTPALKFGGGATGMTTSATVGRYRRRGKWVDFTLRITLTAKGSSTGAATITGLPVTSRNVSSGYSMQTVWLSNTTFNTVPIAFVGPNVSSIELWENVSAGAATTLTEGDFTNTSDVIVSGSYEAADNG